MRVLAIGRPKKEQVFKEPSLAQAVWRLQNRVCYEHKLTRLVMSSGLPQEPMECPWFLAFAARRDCIGVLLYWFRIEELQFHCRVKKQVLVLECHCNTALCNAARNLKLPRVFTPAMRAISQHGLDAGCSNCTRLVQHCKYRFTVLMSAKPGSVEISM